MGGWGREEQRWLPSVVRLGCGRPSLEWCHLAFVSVSELQSVLASWVST